ncbi:flagellar biosynthesis anti-sigma factor FlgM [Sulfurimonas sediminis]|uniref:Flagellar biosynthesis anti-sigma factor FlgM n=1 Tax=Sulfurimonas sediminis TaxID=2590020 RepID=A0A7M1B2T3_9BACT|nr:flagellar biosynthesis anti-sigma factor FlgM [Sulfurimonas sediminis]QOP44069.1 flagellar biosynthesis anti-sigma factor FlgM [Sulfurimonas sediminis]
MISKVNNSVLGSAYMNSTLSNTQKKESTSVTAMENKSSKVEQIKESIDSGQYKVDLSALSKKMADELL